MESKPLYNVTDTWVYTKLTLLFDLDDTQKITCTCRPRAIPHTNDPAWQRADCQESQVALLLTAGVKGTVFFRVALVSVFQPGQRRAPCSWGTG